MDQHSKTYSHLYYELVDRLSSKKAWWYRRDTIARASNNVAESFNQPTDLEIPTFNLLIFDPFVAVFDNATLLIFIGTLLYLIRQLFRHTGHFLSQEPANQTILLACIEGLILLELHGANHGRPLSISEKKRVAYSLGFYLRKGRRRQVPDWVDPQGQTWFLDSIFFEGRVKEIKSKIIGLKRKIISNKLEINRP